MFLLMNCQNNMIFDMFILFQLLYTVQKERKEKNKINK